MLKRYIISTGLAGVITFGLFFLMHSLIALGSKALIKDTGGRKMIEFVRLKKEVQAPMEEQELPQKPAMSKQPPPPQMDMPQTAPRAGGQVLKIAAPIQHDPKPALKMVGGPTLGGAPSDTGHIPLVRVQPMYPPSAAEQRIEGWVRIEFTISETGSVRRPRVIGAHPSSIFNEAAIRAIRKWKYKPRIENGKRVPTPGVRVQLTFKLDDL